MLKHFGLLGRLAAVTVTVTVSAHETRATDDGPRLSGRGTDRPHTNDTVVRADLFRFPSTVRRVPSTVTVTVTVAVTENQPISL
jgi:hypothetical protein